MTTIAPERWAQIPLAPGYEVSSHGRVRSFRRGAPEGGRILSTPTTSGYPVVRILHNGAWRVRLVHQLVLEAFVGARPEGFCTRHLNDIKDDNRVENLAWGTPAENARDCIRNGIHPYASRRECSAGHPYSPSNTTWKATPTAPWRRSAPPRAAPTAS
jgi:hypothetical protein